MLGCALAQTPLWSSADSVRRVGGLESSVLAQVRKPDYT